MAVLCDFVLSEEHNATCGFVNFVAVLTADSEQCYDV